MSSSTTRSPASISPPARRESPAESAALLVIAEWLKNGVPEPRRGVRRLRSLRELLDLDTAVATLSTAPLSSDDVERIVGALRDRALIRGATVGTSPGSEPLLAFLGRFWNYENSPYVLERIAHGQRNSRHHCHDAHNRLSAHWEPYFGKEKTLAGLRRSELNEFSLWLKEKRGLKPNTINRVLSEGTVALHWAARNEMICPNPAEALMTFSSKAAKRGVLTDTEVKELFSKHWPDERCKIGNMLAMSTGLRAGEIIALQVRCSGHPACNTD